MRVLLINPHYPISETPSPPLGLACLASALISVGVEVRILDFVAFPYDRLALIRQLDVFKPQIAGITAVSMNMAEAVKIIQDVKEIRPQTVTVMGGPHATFCARPTLEETPHLDVVVCGEGEQTLVALTEAVEHSRPLNIADDLFTANPAHCLAVCDEIRQKGLNLPWTSFIRVDSI